jgi:hypothetical protein
LQPVVKPQLHSAGDASPRLAALGATLDFHHRLPARSGFAAAAIAARAACIAHPMKLETNDQPTEKAGTYFS